MPDLGPVGQREVAAQVLCIVRCCGTQFLKMGHSNNQRTRGHLTSATAPAPGNRYRGGGTPGCSMRGSACSRLWETSLAKVANVHNGEVCWVSPALFLWKLS